MNYQQIISIFLLSIGLAMDAFSVCVSYGVCHRECNITSALRLSFFTGLFQLIMPLLGWLGGNFIGKFLLQFGPWIAFILLVGLGIKMIIDAFFKKKDCEPVDVSRGKYLFLVCFATSIDAFVAGLSFGIIKTPLLITVICIGTVTFAFSLCGVYLGKIAGVILEKYAEIFGGMILIFLGIKVFI